MATFGRLTGGTAPAAAGRRQPSPRLDGPRRVDVPAHRATGVPGPGAGGRRPPTTSDVYAVDLLTYILGDGAQLAAQPDAARAGAAGLTPSRPATGRGSKAGLVTRDRAAGSGQPRSRRGVDPGRGPPRARPTGVTRGRAPARPGHRRGQLRVRHRDRRGPGQDLRPGRDDVDARGRAASICPGCARSRRRRSRPSRASTSATTTTPACGSCRAEAAMSPRPVARARPAPAPLLALAAAARAADAHQERLDNGLTGARPREPAGARWWRSR